MGGVVGDGAGVANDAGDLVGQFADGDVAARADVDRVGGGGMQAEVERDRGQDAVFALGLWPLAFLSGRCCGIWRRGWERTG